MLSHLKQEMKVIVHVISHWILNNLSISIFLIFFICLKIPVLDFPLYWDEPAYNDLRLLSWDGIKYFFPWNVEHLGLNSHPEGLQFILYWFYQFFGYSVISIHLTALFLSLLAIFCYYELIKDFFNKEIAFVSSILISISPIFFSLSTQLLPDIPTISVSLFAYYLLNKKHYKLFVFIGFLAGLMSESALGFSASLVLVYLIRFIRKQASLKEMLLSTIPVLSLFYFFVKKKIVEGVFVDHPAIVQRENMTNFKWWEIKNENLRTLEAMNDFLYHNSSELLLILAVIGLFIIIAKFKTYFNELFIYLLTSSFAFYAFFFVYGDYHPRNVFPAFNFVFVLFAFPIYELFKRNKMVGRVLFSIVLVLLLKQSNKPFHTGDAIFSSYLEQTSLCKDMFNYIEDAKIKGPFYATFPIAYFFEDPGSGYVYKPLEIHPYFHPHYKNLNGLSVSNTIALTNIESHYQHDYIQNFIRDNGFVLEKYFKRGNTEGWIYTR